jgi:hypothetical protein
MSIRNLADLIDLTGGIVRIGCDTEYQGPHTLTSQFATRLNDHVVVQLYHSPAVPPPPPAEVIEGLLPDSLKNQFDLLFRTPKVIPSDLSPVRLLADLYGLKSVEAVSKAVGCGDGTRDKSAPPITLLLIAHYWPADFFRVFGAEFFAGLPQHELGSNKLFIQAHGSLAFKERRGGYHQFADPDLQYAQEGGVRHSARVRYFDTSRAFGKRSLDDLARSFLGVGKLEELGQADKQDMLNSFQRDPERAYAYALLDAVLALLLEEQMREEDARMYKMLGFEEAEVPPLKPTLGSRVTETIVRSIARAAAGSIELSQKGKPLLDGRPGKVGMNKIKRLLARGSGALLAAPGGSRFGMQTADVHGGLLFTRSPTRFFDKAPEQFRDVDLSGCYAAVIAGLSLYAGAPVVFEPGSRMMRLREAIKLVEKHAAGPDAWVMKVSGAIPAGLNVLIPSTRGALTHANYKSRAAKKRAKSTRHGSAYDWPYDGGKDARGSSLYTDVIEAGIVAWATWLMIQALPRSLRKQYEALEVETVLLYPRKLVADSGPDYDALSARSQARPISWRSEIDLDILQKVVTDTLDDHVALRFNLGDLAQRLSDFRRQAKEEYGKGSGAELSWKQHVNSLYGVLASRHLITNNVVCANVITATSRALAYAMQLSLNGYQVITDGCTYRRDQTPSCTYQECLERCPEYPIRRPEGEFPFLDPSEVPQDDDAYTAWYAEHVKNFFNVSGEEYDRLFGLHRLEHKLCGDPPSPSYDAQCWDGSANYIKLQSRGHGWEVADHKARSFSREAKEVVARWILRTYPADTYVGPPPVTESRALLSFQEACQVARKAFDVLLEVRYEDEFGEQPVAPTVPLRVYLPLGLERRRPQSYKVIRPKAFLFRTPQQESKFTRASEKFTSCYGTGLEALALRRTWRGRRQGSIINIAEEIYRLIRAHEDNPTKALNLTRPFAAQADVLDGHHNELRLRGQELQLRLSLMIDARAHGEETTLTGLWLESSDVPFV